MSLDATVYCDCVERGRLRKPCPFPDRIYIEEDGSPDAKLDNLDDEHVFDRWRWYDACEHQDCVLLHHRIGNIALVGCIRHIVSGLALASGRSYSVILTKVVYSGSHCGDFLSLTDVQQLLGEIEQLRGADLSSLSDEDRGFLKQFLTEMEELARASLTVEKPIVF